MAKTLHPQIPIAFGRSHVQVYGERYEHSPPEASDYQQSKADAIQKAEQRGLAIQSAMEARKCAKLTHRERVHGKLEQPAPKKPFQSCTPAVDPDRSPYTAVIQELNARPGHTEIEKAQSAKRLLMYQQKEAEWVETRAATVAKEARDADPEIQRARAHAKIRYEEMRLSTDPADSPLIDAAEKSLRAIEGDTMRSGEYWQSLGGHPAAADALNKAVLGEGNV